jgi:hypothetical protein
VSRRSVISRLSSEFCRAVAEEAPRCAREAAASCCSEETDNGLYFADDEDGEDAPIMPIDKWVESEYHVGAIAREAWDPLKQLFVDTWNKRPNELVIGGAIGGGKSYFVRLCQLRSLYVLSTYKRPAVSIGRQIGRTFSSTDPIVCMNFNVNQTKAKSAWFVSLVNAIKANPYFCDLAHRPLNFPRDLTRNQQHVENTIRFPGNVVCSFAGASPTAAESEALFFAVLDEINMYESVERSRKTMADEGGKYDAAQIIWQNAWNRIISRYQNRQTDELPEGCMLVSVCRETSKDSFIRRRMKEVKRQRLDVERVLSDGSVRKPSVVCLEWPQWGLNPKESTERRHFWISTPTRTRAPEITDDKQRMLELQAESKRLEQAWIHRHGEESDPSDDEEWFKIVEVPGVRGGKYWMQAKDNPYEFLNQQAGVPSSVLSVFLKDRDSLMRCVRKSGQTMWSDIFDGGEDKVLPEVLCHQPFNAQETTLENDGVVFMPERVLQKRRVNLAGVFYDETRPIAFPDKPRYVGVDIGVSRDSASIAVCCPAGYKKMKVLDTDSSQMVTKMMPVVWVDMVLRIIPPPGGEIVIRRILALLRVLERNGFRFKRVGGDTYQSKQLLQDAADLLDVETENVSTVTSPDPFLLMRNLFRQHRISLPNHDMLITEFSELEETKQVVRRSGRDEIHLKIDHPPRGSKDCADALATAVWMVHRDLEEESESVDFVTSGYTRKEQTAADILGISPDEVRQMVKRVEAAERFDLDRLFELDVG